MVLRHLARLGTGDDSESTDPNKPSLRVRLSHQLSLLKKQGEEECSSEPNFPEFARLAEAALAVFCIPVGESHDVELSVLEAQIREYSSKSESFQKVLHV
jgi:hypothetical protein